MVILQKYNSVCFNSSKFLSQVRGFVKINVNVINITQISKD